MSVAMKPLLIDAVTKAIHHYYTLSIDPKLVVIMRTKKQFDGELSIVVTPIAKKIGVDISELAENVGDYLKNTLGLIERFDTVAHFLNMRFTNNVWLDTFAQSDNLQTIPTPKRVVIEYGSPNTNKPLHLGHVRNCILGRAVANMYKAIGYDVRAVQIINDRGIHICQSMVAWMLYGNQETPEDAALKGDHLVGKYYVRYSEVFKEEVQSLVEKGVDSDAAKVQAPIYVKAQELLVKWEANDPEVRALWKQLNAWVYDGFSVTYKRLGVDFDKNYYESDTYLQGKSLVEDGLRKGCFYKKEDGSIWVNVEDEGLDHKLLLRADGTSVYITQDIATALLRYKDYQFDKMIYTVANEQIYHFDVLFALLKKMGYAWSEHMHHLSYGMVMLPSGKMKSREGTVVDADDLLDTMVSRATDMGRSLGKADTMSKVEASAMYNAVAHAALNYWVLKVDASKNMLFDPKESIAFTGNTGPFIQYTYARIQSVLRKSSVSDVDYNDVIILDKERELIYLLAQYQEVLYDAVDSTNPSILANYLYNIVKIYNGYYQETPILSSHEVECAWRICLSRKVAQRVSEVAKILHIPLVNKM